ncbi:hypothetical protein ACWD6R_38525 [Streptomyces sp. NPDC005151]
MSDLLLVDITGHGDLMLPTGSMEVGETPEQAAQPVLLGASNTLTILRRVAVDQVQTRRRKVITHIVATQPLAQDDAAVLFYRDPRAVLLSMPCARAISSQRQGIARNAHTAHNAHQSNPQVRAMPVN